MWVTGMDHSTVNLAHSFAILIRANKVGFDVVAMSPSGLHFPLAIACSEKFAVFVRKHVMDKLLAGVKVYDLSDTKALSIEYDKYLKEEGING